VGVLLGGHPAHDDLTAAAVLLRSPRR